MPSDMQLAKVPLRLTPGEREVYDLLLSSLKVSEYTNEVDGVSSYRRERIMKDAMIDLFTTIVGLSHVAETMPKDTLAAMADGDLSMKLVEPILANAFEIARRFKRINPDKMRSEYGKLTMMLQDLHVFKLFNFDAIVKPIKTVGRALDAMGASAMLTDDRLSGATHPLPKNATADQVQEKAALRVALIDEYGGPLPGVSSEDDADAVQLKLAKSKRDNIERCILSLDDAETFVSINTRPIRKLLAWLQSMKGKEDQHSLAIRSGKKGSCLTHSHDQQFGYVREAMSLWLAIQENIFEFWQTVEDDMVLSGTRYMWTNTGQGFARMSSGPKTYALIKAAIAKTQAKLGGWVGSQVVHLGDRDVPNPLVFIDKYTIIPNLLGPVVQFVENLDALFEGPTETYPGMRKMILDSVGSSFKTHEDIRFAVLQDFFQHGFDGSGDDGGACIDGRLTSAWNWCSLIEKKPYYSLFKLTGFNGFDSNYN